MKLKKLLVTGLCLSLLFTTSSVMAQTPKENNYTEQYSVKVYDTTDTLQAGKYSQNIGSDAYTAPEILDDIGNVLVKQNLSINNISVPLYPVFKNQEDALNNIKDTCSDVLNILAENYNLEEFSENNWQQYRESMINYLNNENRPEWYTEDNEMYVKLDSFFDIYENEKQNEELINMAESVDSVEALLETTDFANTLSWKYNEEFCEKIAEDANVEFYNYRNRIQPRSYSVSKAVSYAKKYAVNENQKKYGYIKGADCTNFVSQVMHEGGQLQNDGWKCYKLLGKFHYTKAWCNANMFANYWGVDYKYSSHTSFANKLKKGDYISIDYTWDLL